MSEVIASEVQVLLLLIEVYVECQTTICNGYCVVQNVILVELVHGCKFVGWVNFILKCDEVVKVLETMFSYNKDVVNISEISMWFQHGLK